MRNTTLAVVAALALACDGSEQMRSELEIHRAEWARRIAALQAHAVDVESAFAAMPRPARGDARAPGQLRRLRLEASIAGSRQALADLETHLAQSVRDVEAAIGRDGAEGREALNGLIGRMDEYVRQQEEALATNQQALNRTGEDVGR
jgi:hypothetical protein